ncbi:hypothetical protein Patl1_19827 [Pistacia atlantica]|uniref:Uncharacterized protein n=1 Tax=Pistacia atlantica TaxID=434234 RepID=A0ACC1BLL2_9ROSI|nr:hypothetical protein Patl1_19827 [Pistacia atlantica]
MNGLSFYNCTLPKLTNLPTALVDTPGRSQTIISHKQLVDKLGNATEEKNCLQLTLWKVQRIPKPQYQIGLTGMALPFEPLTLTFENVQYFADTPKVFQRKRLQLLQDFTGAFRPGILTALMGVSGAGKTTPDGCFFWKKDWWHYRTRDQRWRLILVKRGGQIMYSGELGQHSSKLIEYFEGISGVPKIKENYNPARWMLEVTNLSMEAQLGLDFAHLYKESHLCRESTELVRELSLPTHDSKQLHISTRFSQNGWEQFKACLWKQRLTCWRCPNYNLVRLAFVTVSSLLLGAVLWQKGQKM